MTTPLAFMLSVIVAAVTVHVFYCRLFGARSKRSPQKVLGLVIIAGDILLLTGLTSTAIAEGLLHGGALIAYCLIVYNAVMYSYFHLFNMSETARRIRILLNVLEHGVLRREKILAIYSPCDMVMVRLERLVLMGWLKRNSAGRYMIGAGWALRLAQGFRLMRQMMGFAVEKVRSRKGGLQ